ncbi:hypothetical protein [Fimbriimonas ginsengisoli]|nr:hypothetical protein [Fimbriimonas ginsengisoli]
MRRLLVLAQVKEPSLYDVDARNAAKAEKAAANRAKLVALVTR